MIFGGERCEKQPFLIPSSPVPSTLFLVAITMRPCQFNGYCSAPPAARAGIMAWKVQGVGGGRKDGVGSAFPDFVPLFLPQMVPRVRALLTQPLGCLLLSNIGNYSEFSPCRSFGVCFFFLKCIPKLDIRIMPLMQWWPTFFRPDWTRGQSVRAIQHAGLMLASSHIPDLSMCWPDLTVRAT